MLGQYALEILYLGAQNFFYDKFKSLSQKNNWHVTLLESCPDQFFGEEAHDLFILVPSDARDLPSYLHYFITCKQSYPWAHAILIYDFFLKQEDVEKMTHKIDCKVLGRGEMKHLPKYIDFVKQKLGRS